MANSSLPILHRPPRPIDVLEFRDAVYATCRPRFPRVQYARPLRLAIAVSGGLDSMALAHLSRSLIKFQPGVKIADNPVVGVDGVIVDHQLREGSSAEAAAVARELSSMGVKAVIRTLKWPKYLREEGIDPSSLPNVESRARELRYASIGKYCSSVRTSSIFLAHHRDDQYETILMRLLNGHGYRGLQGMRDASPIPECYNQYGSYLSGMLEDQRAEAPRLSFKPTRRLTKRLRHRYSDAKVADKKVEDSWDQIRSYLDELQPTMAMFPGHIERRRDTRAPYLDALHTEDGGLTIYRPLLEFDKDRLAATCEANKVAWFQDQTNFDPTLTTRNAVRHLAKTHQLPRALQKPAVLRLATRARQRVQLVDAEAHRLLVREAVIRDFDPNTGTLLVELPDMMAMSRGPTRSGTVTRLQARKGRQRAVAIIAVRKMIDFVTPDHHLPSLSNLGNVADRLFPELADEVQPGPPKAFSVAGVLFDPMPGPQGTRHWYLSRTPYPSSQPLPISVRPGGRSCQPPVHPDQTQWRRSMKWKQSPLWDGRYWLVHSLRRPDEMIIGPLEPTTLKPFRKALPEDQRRRLDELLRYYAPGKVRYTLPALYIQGEGEVRSDGSRDAAALSRLTLLSLPSLGIGVPGLERWAPIEASYKKVDTSLLGHTKRGHRTANLGGYRSVSSMSRKMRRARLSTRLPTAARQPLKGACPFSSRPTQETQSQSLQQGSSLAKSGCDASWSTSGAEEQAGQPNAPL